MYDQWPANDWHDSAGFPGRGATLEVSLNGQAIDIDEEAPKPFLNEYLPTQEEIRIACQEIQQGWTDAERRRRRGYRRGHTLPHGLRVVRTAFSS